MPLSPELVARCGDLKRELVAFGESRRFARQLDEAVWREVDETGSESEGTVINAIDRFILQHRLPDGRTIVEIFVRQHPNLSEEERALLLGWRDVIEGVFEVERRDGDGVVATNLFDDLTYRLRSNVGPEIFDRMPPGSFIMSRAVPLGDEWMLSGATSTFPADARDEVYRAAASAAMSNARQVYRNPEKLALGWEQQRREHEQFVDYFGSDLVVLPGQQVEERFRAFRHHQTHEARDSEGKTAADRTREQYGTEPAALDFSLPPALLKADTVGMIYDAIDGLNFWPDYGRLEEAFANPDLVARGPHRDIVVNYLDEPSFPPLALRRLAERDPERASQVFAQVLKRPKFSWERDGETLLRTRKASYFERTPLPSAIVLSDRLSRASLSPAKTKTVTQDAIDKTEPQGQPSPSSAGRRLKSLWRRSP